MTAAPAHLSERAKTEYQRLAPAIEASAGERAAPALSVLAAYCQVWARWVDAEEQINKYGTILKGPNGRVFPSPYLPIATKALTQLREFAAQLGLEVPGAPSGSATVSAFGRRVGVDESVVRKGIRTGRLSRSLGRDARGRVTIVDVALAEQEWVANMDPSKIRVGPETNGSALEATADSRRRVMNAQATRLEQDVAKRAGELVPKRAMELRVSAQIVAARTRILGVPSRAKQRLPHLSVTDLTVIEALIREALEEIADGI